MVANLILLCSLKTYLFSGIWKHNHARKHGLSYSSLSFFSFFGGHLSTHCFRCLEHFSIFSILFLFFMNNFCIATCFFSATKLLRDGNNNLEHLFGGYPIKNIFGVFSQCRSKTFWVDLDGMTCCCAYP